MSQVGLQRDADRMWGDAVFGWGRRAALKSKMQELAIFVLGLRAQAHGAPWQELTAALEYRGFVVDGGEVSWRNEASVRLIWCSKPTIEVVVTYQADKFHSIVAMGYDELCGLHVHGGNDGDISADILPVGLNDEVGRDARAMQAELSKIPGFYSFDATLFGRASK